MAWTSTRRHVAFLTTVGARRPCVVLATGRPLTTRVARAPSVVSIRRPAAASWFGTHGGGAEHHSGGNNGSTTTSSTLRGLRSSFRLLAAAGVGLTAVGLAWNTTQCQTLIYERAPSLVRVFEATAANVERTKQLIYGRLVSNGTPWPFSKEQKNTSKDSCTRHRGVVDDEESSLRTCDPLQQQRGPTPTASVPSTHDVDVMTDQERNGSQAGGASMRHPRPDVTTGDSTRLSSVPPPDHHPPKDGLLDNNNNNNHQQSRTIPYSSEDPAVDCSAGCPRQHRVSATKGDGVTDDEEDGVLPSHHSTTRQSSPPTLGPMARGETHHRVEGCLPLSTTTTASSSPSSIPPSDAAGIIAAVIAQHETIDALRRQNLQLELSCHEAEWQERAQLLIENALEKEREKHKEALKTALEEQRAEFLEETHHAVDDVAKLRLLKERVDEMLDTHIRTLRHASAAYDLTRYFLQLESCVHEHVPVAPLLKAFEESAKDDPLIGAILHSIPPNVAQRLEQGELPTHTMLQDALQAAYVSEKGGLFAHVIAGVLKHIDRLVLQAGVSHVIPPSVLRRPSSGARVNVPVLYQAAHLVRLGKFDSCLEVLTDLEGLSRVVMEDWMADVRATLTLDAALKAVRAHLQASLLSRTLQTPPQQTESVTS